MPTNGTVRHAKIPWKVRRRGCDRSSAWPERLGLGGSTGTKGSTQAATGTVPTEYSLGCMSGPKMSRMRGATICSGARRTWRCRSAGMRRPDVPSPTPVARLSRVGRSGKRPNLGTGGMFQPRPASPDPGEIVQLLTCVRAGIWGGSAKVVAACVRLLRSGYCLTIRSVKCPELHSLFLCHHSFALSPRRKEGWQGNEGKGITRQSAHPESPLTSVLFDGKKYRTLCVKPATVRGSVL